MNHLTWLLLLVFIVALYYYLKERFLKRGSETETETEEETKKVLFDLI